MRESAAKKDRNGIQVIARAAEVLRVLEASGQSLSLGEVAQRTNLPRSTIQRISEALLDEGLLSREAGKRGLRLGPELARLGERARIDVKAQCRQLLTEVASKTGETTDLAVRRGKAMEFLDQVAGSHRLRAVSAIGDVFPLTTTANGRASAARLSDDQIRALAAEELAAMNQPGAQERFFQLIEDVRETGLAYDLEEHTSGISAVGIAFQDVTGMTYAISVPVPAARFNASRAKIERALLDARDQLSNMTGIVV